VVLGTRASTPREHSPLPHRTLYFGLMPLTGLMTEALLLGVSSGPVCLASCTPVLIPVLAAEQRSPRGTGALLAQFLGGRLPGLRLSRLASGPLAPTSAARPRPHLRPCRPRPGHLPGRIRLDHAHAPSGVLRSALPRRPRPPLRAALPEFRLCYSRICGRPHIERQMVRRQGLSDDRERIIRHKL